MCKASNCGENSVPLYYCPKHKKIFCLKCMTRGSKVNNFNEVAHCHRFYFLGEFYNKEVGKYDPVKHDCIYERIDIIEDKEKCKGVENEN